MSKIHFASGKTIDITKVEFDKMPPRLQRQGIRIYKTWKGDLVPLNSYTIEFVERGDYDDEPTGTRTMESDIDGDEGSVVSDDEEGEGEGGTNDEVPSEPEPKKETVQEAKDRIMQEMIEKSNCAGNGHAGKEQIIFYQDVTINKKGAKTGVASRRYFPVCSFCGLRQKYIKAADLTQEQKDNAKQWIEG